MLVERVEESEADLEVPALANRSVLGERNVHILGIRASQVGDARSRSRVAEDSRASRACARWFEAAERFKCRRGEKRALARIVAIWILKEGICALPQTHEAVLAELRHHLARGRTEPHRG